MEKYSRWRDAGTGIQPFLPPVPPRTESSVLLTLSNIVRYTLGPVLGIAKLALISVAALLYILLVPVAGTLLSPLGPIRRIWSRFWSFLLLRLILFLSGFFYIKTETVSLRRGNAKGSKKKLSSVRSGDIIVANWISYIDVLYLACLYDPVFTRIYPNAPKNKNMQRIGFWSALRLCTRMPELTSNSTELSSLKQIAADAAKRRRGPVIVFPEGTTSNGRALLKFAPVFKDYQPSDRNVRFHLFAFRYEHGNMSPTYTAGNQMWHFFRVCSQFYNIMTIKRLAADDVPCNPNMNSSQQASDFATLAGSNNGGSTDDYVGGQLMVCLSNMSRLRKTNLDMSDKREFLEYYYLKDKSSARKQEQQRLRSTSSKRK